MVLNSGLYNFSFKQFCSTYQNHVLHKNNYKSVWSLAMTETTDIKNDNGRYKPNAVHKVCDTWPPLDTLLPLATVFFTKYVVVKET